MLRGGYSVHFVEDHNIYFAYSAGDPAGSGVLNAGTQAVSSRIVEGRVSDGLPSVARPAFGVPRKASDNLALNRGSGLALIDPRLRTPYVQEWSLGVQRKVGSTFLEVRYVGSHAVKLIRPLNYNQVILRENGFLEDFERARSNGNLARAATGVFDPKYNPQIDNNNRAIARARSEVDITHALKGFVVWDLPLGPGRRLDVRLLRPWLTGWTVSANVSRYSGVPFSVLSGRGTLTAEVETILNPATTTLDKAQLSKLFHFRQTGAGAYFVDPSILGKDGRAAGPDNAPFPGQVFFHPAPGSVGSLQPRLLDGPAIFAFHSALIKVTRIRDRHTLEVRAESLNALNHPQWSLDRYQRIDNPTFGRMQVDNEPRTILLGLRYRF